MHLKPGRIRAALGVVAALFFLVALFYRQPGIPTDSAQFHVGVIPAVPARRPAAGITYAIDTIEVDGAQRPINDPAPITSRGFIVVHGWAVTPESLAPGRRLLVSVDAAPASPVASYGAPRPDVAAAINPAAENSGFAATIRTTGLRPGPHTLRFTLERPDGTLTALPTPVTFSLD